MGATATVNEKLLLTISEASERLNLNRSYVYDRLIARGELRSVKIGRRRLIPVRDLEAYVEGLRETGGDAA